MERTTSSAGETTGRHWRWLLLIVALAGALRLGYVHYLPGQGRDLLHSDMGVYDQSGWCMAQGLPVEGALGFNGYHPLSASTYYYAGYTYFLAAVYAVFGHNLEAVRIIQGLISTATVAVVYWVGGLLFDRRAALCAAILTAVYLPFTYYTGLLLSETVFIFLQMLALGVWLTAWGVGRTTPRSNLLLAGVAGLLAGLACLTRTGFVPALVTLAIGGWCVSSRDVAWLRGGAMASSFLLCALAVILPVTVRNYQIHGRFILLSTNGPSTFYTGHVSHTPFLPNDPPPGATDVDMADEYRRQSWAYLREHWTKYLAEIPEFFAAIWIDGHFWPNTTTYWNYRAAFDPQRPSRVVVMIDEAGGPAFGTVAFFSDLVRYVDHVVWLLIGLPMGLLAVLFLRRENRWWLLIYLALVPYLIVPFIAPPFCRYRIPAVPLMFILAAHTIGTIWQSRKPARVGGGC